MLTQIDENGNSFEARLKNGKKSEPLTPIKISNGESELTEFRITAYDKSNHNSLKEMFDEKIKPLVSSFDYKEQTLLVSTIEADYWFDNDRETLIKAVNGKEEELGCGKIVVKASYKKATKTQSERIEITAELTPDYQKDYEIIPYHKDKETNKANIQAFMEKYVTKPFKYLDNVVGVEINFNKVFYKPEKLRPVADILADIEAVDDELRVLEEGLGL